MTDTKLEWPKNDFAEVGDIVPYAVETGTAPNVVEGVYPLLVVSVNPDDGTYSGVVFLGDGTSTFVHVVAPEPTEPDPVPQSVEDSVANLNPVERAELLAELQKTAPGSPDASVPPPPVTNPFPAPPNAGA